MRIENNVVYADENKFVHRKNSDTYFKASALSPNESMYNFEEVNSIPTELEELKKLKIEEIKDYDISTKVNLFSILNTPIWLDKDTRTGLKLRFEAEKAKGIKTTNLWYEGLTFALSIDTAIAMLYDIELYASLCYDNTQRHISNVSQLETELDIINYNYKIGYPEMLNL